MKTFLECFASAVAGGVVVHFYYAPVVAELRKALLNVEASVQSKFKKVL